MRPASRIIASLSAVAALALGGCGSEEPVVTDPGSPTGTAPAPREPRLLLAARAAAAQDLQTVGRYAWKSSGHPDRTVTVTLAGRSGWRIDATATALGGTVDVSIVRTGNATYYCALPSPGFTTPACVAITKYATSFDPRVEHIFTDWLDVFTDRDVALVVSLAAALPSSSGTCFSVDTSTVSVKAPLDPGIYCFTDDGTLTAAKTPFGTLTLISPPAKGPATIDLPAPQTTGKPLPLASPSPSASPSRSVPAPSPSLKP